MQKAKIDYMQWTIDYMQWKHASMHCPCWCVFSNLPSKFDIYDKTRKAIVFGISSLLCMLTKCYVSA